MIIINTEIIWAVNGRVVWTCGVRHAVWAWLKCNTIQYSTAWSNGTRWCLTLRKVTVGMSESNGSTFVMEDVGGLQRVTTDEERVPRKVHVLGGCSTRGGCAVGCWSSRSSSLLWTKYDINNEQYLHMDSTKYWRFIFTSCWSWHLQRGLTNFW